MVKVGAIGEAVRNRPRVRGLCREPQGVTIPSDSAPAARECLGAGAAVTRDFARLVNPESLDASSAQEPWLVDCKRSTIVLTGQGGWRRLSDRDRNKFRYRQMGIPTMEMAIRAARPCET